MAKKVKIPAEVFKGIIAVRATGRTNMFDANAVAAIALELGYFDAAYWLTDKANRKAYAQGIFNDFEEAETPAR